MDSLMSNTPTLTVVLSAASGATTEVTTSVVRDGTREPPTEFSNTLVTTNQTETPTWLFTAGLVPH